MHHFHELPAGKVAVFVWTWGSVQRHSNHIPIVADLFQIFFRRSEFFFRQVGYGVGNSVIFQQAQDRAQAVSLL